MHLGCKRPHCCCTLYAPCPIERPDAFVAEYRTPRRDVTRAPGEPGRRSAIASDIIARIHAERAAGRSYGVIARGLDADGVRPAQGGVRW